MQNRIAATHIRVEPQKKLKHAVVYFSTMFFIALQGLAIILLYAYLAYKFPLFFYISLALTGAVFLFVAISEKRTQVKISWLVLLILSCGFGYILYFLAMKEVCFFIGRLRFSSIFKRTRKFEKSYTPPEASPVTVKHCNYINSQTRAAAYSGCSLKYFADGTAFFGDFFKRLESAQKFVFIEFFIFADCKLADRLCEVLKRKAAEGVEVRILYDAMGSLGMVSGKTIKDLKSHGVKTAVFSRLLIFFRFSLNFRDHRKIIVIDGKTGYVGGSNIADECVNQSASTAKWKDAGLRLDGEAVDALTLSFIRQWDFAAHSKTNPESFSGLSERFENKSTVMPYSGGPELGGKVLRGVYANMIDDAQEKLYIMTPYLAPDGEIIKNIERKARSGTDVRIVLPAVPDWKFLYAVTVDNAEKLIRSGVKIYYLENTLAHGKVMLTDSAAAVGSVNMDMRSFYEEYDNGVYTDDTNFRAAVQADFKKVFAVTPEAEAKKRGIFSKCKVAILRLFSPLM